tara:strand:- start:2471 stop:3103 length:633 start_codon:yes stop_codon:yes gene_type:complete
MTTAFSITDIFNRAVTHLEAKPAVGTSKKNCDVADEIQLRLWEENFWDLWWFVDVDWNKGPSDPVQFDADDLNYMTRFSKMMEKVVLDGRGRFSTARHARLNGAIRIGAFIKWIEFANKCAKDIPEFAKLSVKTNRSAQDNKRYTQYKNNLTGMLQVFDSLNAHILRLGPVETRYIRNVMIRPVDAALLYNQAAAFKVKHEKDMKSRWRP